MRERGILFSAAMVQALLARSKTQTRRVARPGERPYAAPGDRLWVREAWALVPWADGADRRRPSPHDDEGVRYRATWAGPPPARWRSPIHMPRWASRLSLAVTAVRVEPLHAIDEADAIAEGVVAVAGGYQGAGGEVCPSAVAAYASRWEAIHGAGAWRRNDDVWVVSFVVEE